MPLESASYISELVTSNPAASDGMNNADDHMRLTKAAVKNSFPNISGEVTASHTQMNTAFRAVLTDGVTLFDDDGVAFKTSGDGFVNPLAGDIDVKLQGVVAATFQRTGGVNFFKVKGALQVDSTITSGAITAPGSFPIGGVMIWPMDALPPTTEGVWWWCNGAAVERAAYPILFARLGTYYGAGNGATTFNLPNYSEVTLVGKSGMGSSAARGLLTHIADAFKAVLGGLFGAGTHTLTQAEIASHYHAAGIYDPGHTHGGGIAGLEQRWSNGATFYQVSIVNNSNVSTNATGVHVNSSNGLDTTYSAGGGGAHNNVQPSMAVNFIIRLA